MSAAEQIDHVKTWFGSKTLWANGIGILSLAVPAVGHWAATTDVNVFAQTAADVVAGLCFIASSIFRAQAKGPLVASPTVAKAANENIANGATPVQAVKMAKLAA